GPHETRSATAAREGAAMKRFHPPRSGAEETLPADAVELLARIKRLTPHTDLDLIRRAFLFAQDAHAGQTRASGEVYIGHSVAVASILADLRLDAGTIAVALLHDVPEVTPDTIEELQHKFGP